VRSVLVLAAACSTLIETGQYVLQLGRVSSVDDVLLNTAGAGLAALASRRWWAGEAVAPAVPTTGPAADRAQTTMSARTGRWSEPGSLRRALGSSEIDGTG